MAVELLQVDLKDIGVILRDKLLIHPLKLFKPIANYKINISPDENGDYTITSAIINPTSYHALYDGNNKILEWHCDEEDQLSIYIFTNKQVNLFVDFDVKQCRIQANGPLLIKGGLHVESTLSIDAEALLLADSIVCDGEVSLALQQGVGFLASVSAKHLLIHAAYVHQSANFNVSGVLDVSTQFFKQEPPSKTNVESLRLLATSQCQIAGDLTVTNACFLTVNNNMVFGLPGTESTIKLPGNNHLHIANLLVHGDTQIYVGDRKNNISGSFIVDHNLFMGKSTLISIYHTNFSAEFIDNLGEISAEKCTIGADEVLQNGIFDAEQSKITISKRFNQGKFALSELKKTNFVCRDITGAGGRLFLDACHYYGQDCNIYAGIFEVKNSSELNIIGALLLDNAASCTVKDSKFLVEQNARLVGKSCFHRSDVQAGYLHASENVVIITKSNIRAVNELRFDQGADVRESKLIGKTVKLIGHLNINEVDLYIHHLELSTQHAEINKMYSHSDILELQGSSEPDQVVFKDSVLTTKQFSSREHVTLDSTVVFGIDQNAISHDLRKHLKLRESQFITDSQVNIHSNSHFEVNDFSTVRSGMIHSKGIIKARDSNVFCEAVLQDTAELNLQSSTIMINQGLFSRASTTLLNHQSVVMAPNALLGQGGSLSLNDKSTLVTSNAISTGATTIISSKDSRIATRKFTILGRAELVSSILSAEELRIYDQFSAQDSSKIMIDKLFSVAKDGHAKITDTFVASHDVQSFGEVLVRDSVIAAKNKVSVWSAGTLALQENSAIVAEDMVVRGKLTTGTQPGLTSEKKQKGSSQLRVNNLLHNTEGAMLTGNEDLNIEAAEIMQSGTVDLSAELKVKGGLFSNHGSVKADTLYLGFDDQVANFGSFSANNMTVHSNFVNCLGGVFVKQSYTCSGFYGINFGLIAANSYSNSTLLSINGGLVTPNLSADLKYIFSVSNLTSVAKTAACMAVPGYTNTINLAFMIPGLVNTAYALPDMYKQLSSDKLKSMRAHEWMPLLGQLKNVGMFAWGAGNSAYSSASEWSSLGSDLQSLAGKAFDFDYSSSFNGSQCKDVLFDINWQKVGTTVATTFAGSYTDTSLLQVNVGACFAGSTQKTSLIDVNLGFEGSLLSHTINTHYLYNSGYSIGGESTFLATNISNSGTLEGTRQFTLKADKMGNQKSGVVDGAHANVTINTLDQEGHFTLSSGQAKLDHVSDTEGATTEFTEMLVTGSSLDVQGGLTAEKVQFKYTDTFTIKDGAEFKTDDVAIETGEFSLRGQLDYQHTLTLKAKVAHLEKSSIVNGMKTEDEQLFVVRDSILDTPSEASNGEESKCDLTTPPQEPQKDFKPQHVLIIEAQHAELNGRLSGGDYTKIQGVTTESQDDKAGSKCDSLTIGDEAQIQLTYGAIDARNVVNAGNLDLSKFSLNIDTLAQEKTMSLDGCSGQIDHVNDTATAVTSVTDSALKGDSFQLKGELATKNSRFDYKQAFTTNAGSKLKTDNVEIVTDKFTHEGSLSYQHSLAVTAIDAMLKKGSVVQGAKTDEEQLFVTQTAVGDATDSEPKKDFKPQHVLIIEAKHVELNGRLTGGDYTKIQGVTPEQSDDKTTTKCESLVIGESANIDLQYGSISSRKAIVSGQAQLNGFEINIDNAREEQGGHLGIVHSSYTGDSLTSAGTLNLDHSVVKVANIDLGRQAKETVVDSTIYATTFRDNSHLNYQGQAAIVTEKYEHGGVISKTGLPTPSTEKNSFYVKSKTADLHGSANFDNAFFEIERYKDGADLVAGRGLFSAYHVSDNLMFETLDSFRLDRALTRDCNVTVKANDISINADFTRAHDLSLISTAGDVSLMSNIQLNNLYVQSAGSVWMNHNIYTNSVASFEAKGGFYNLGGTLNADVASVKASEIKNISSGSAAASWSWGKSMGSSGIINGRTNTYLEATQGNVENYGGIIRAGDYTQILAKGDVVNTCNIRTFRGAYDVQQAFDAGLIAGGNGVKTDGIGLYIKADGRIISDASDFVSNGTNYLEADKGFNFTARQQTYVSAQWTTKKWYGKKESHTATSTTFKGTEVHSGSGVNILRTEHGGVHSVATRFSSPGGTQVYARDDVLLFSLKSQNKEQHSKSSFWGLSKHSSSATYQTATPTLFIDNGITRITSTNGSVDARGAYFAGAGDLYIDAKERIKFGVDILDNEIREKSHSLGVSVPGMGAWQAWQNSGKIMDAVTAEDATLAKLNSLLQSGNTSELLANSANLGVNLYNTTNSAMRGLANGTVGDELLARYGLGGAKGFSPAITFSETETRTTTKFQTLGQGGVERGGNVFLKAGEGIDLENGVRVHAGGTMEIDSPELIARAAALQSSMKQKMTTESISVSALGDIQDAAVSYSKTEAQATNYVNAELSADGGMKLHYQDGAMHRVELDGATIQARTLDAEIEKLVITDKQNVATNHVESVSASLSGQVSVNNGKGTSITTGQQSGIHVIEGINVDGHTVHIVEAVMHGGKITTDGENCIEIDKLVTEKLVDEQHYSGMGISFNVNDLHRLAEQKPTNEAGEQAIAIAEVSVDRVRYQADYTSVINGSQGTHAVIKVLEGDLHTDSADGCQVIKDDELHLKLDIPVTNEAYLAKSRENIQSGLQVITAAFAGPKLPDKPLRVVLDEPVLPSKREEDVEELSSIEDKPKKPNDKDSDEVKISPEVAKEIMDKVVTDLGLLSPEEKKSLAEEMKAYDEDRKKTGISDNTKLAILNEHIKSAILQTLKAGSEEGWGNLTHALGHEYNQKITKLLSSPEGLSKLGIKTYMGTKGLLISLSFNFASASVDSTVDRKHLIKEALATTAADVTFNILLKFSTGSAAGPIGMFVTGLGVLDTLTYNEQFVDSLFKDGLSNYKESQSFFKSNYLAGIGLQQQAAMQVALAGRAQAWHMLINIPNYMTSGVKYCWDKVTRKTAPPSPPPLVSQLPSIDRTSLFSPVFTQSSPPELVTPRSKT